MEFIRLSLLVFSLLAYGYAFQPLFLGQDFCGLSRRLKGTINFGKLYCELFLLLCLNHSAKIRQLGLLDFLLLLMVILLLLQYATTLW